MFTKNNKRQPLLRYWTRRYLITLFLGLFLIGLISTALIRQHTTRRHLDALQALAITLAEKAVGPDGTLFIDPNLPREIQRSRRLLSLSADLLLFMVDRHNQIVFSTPDLPPMELLRRINIPGGQEQGVQRLQLGSQVRFYLLKQGISHKEQKIGTIYLIYPHQEVNRNPEAIELLLFMLGSLALLGWFSIYFLTRQLTKPIHKVAEAARQIVKGEYNLTLTENVREQEVYELIRAFKDMATRLKQLEVLRTELLAQVTHELKTPVTVISGLLQALQDQVVTGEEAKEFLALCRQESIRLEKMVEDLLAFNAFLTGAVPAEKSISNLNALVREITTQWLLGQEKGTVTLNTRLPEQELMLATDPLRIRQILYNLLNNAKQACPEGKRVQIEVSLYQQENAIWIDVKDNGPGIPLAEQEFLFERFFRGHAKKTRQRGLGLGLPLSKLMAQTLGGDLYLKETSAQGSTFTLTFEK